MSEKTVQLNVDVIKGQLKELVRGSVEETLNELQEAETKCFLELNTSGVLSTFTAMCSQSRLAPR